MLPVSCGVTRVFEVPADCTVYDWHKAICASMERDVHSHTFQLEWPAPYFDVELFPQAKKAYIERLCQAVGVPSDGLKVVEMRRKISGIRQKLKSDFEARGDEQILLIHERMGAKARKKRTYPGHFYSYGDGAFDGSDSDDSDDSGDWAMSSRSQQSNLRIVVHEGWPDVGSDVKGGLMRMNEDWFERMPCDPGEAHVTSRKTTFGSLNLRVGELLTYTWDLGDNWKHLVVIEDITRAGGPSGSQHAVTAVKLVSREGEDIASDGAGRW